VGKVSIICFVCEWACVWLHDRGYSASGAVAEVRKVPTPHTIHEPIHMNTADLTFMP
jgi:hypothetical protein